MAAAAVNEAPNDYAITSMIYTMAIKPTEDIETGLRGYHFPLSSRCDRHGNNRTAVRSSTSSCGALHKRSSSTKSRQS
jgi:hypothetical protein